MLKQIILKEKPDSVLPTLGGQAGLNLGMELAESGFLEENGVKLIGTTAETIFRAEDRQAFKDTMEKIGEPCAASLVVNTWKMVLNLQIPSVIRLYCVRLYLRRKRRRYRSQ